ncbi:hypothetical protein M5K25_023340 [Dendrobium thyrsiflorum]|uniref:Uncharacterized protein n=1 Tax=Dendrobium thyrsiflorum TaxID=117978 RepID=A0ABD0UEN8_DENTH
MLQRWPLLCPPYKAVHLPVSLAILLIRGEIERLERLILDVDYARLQAMVDEERGGQAMQQYTFTHENKGFTRYFPLSLHSAISSMHHNIFDSDRHIWGDQQLLSVGEKNFCYFVICCVVYYIWRSRNDARFGDMIIYVSSTLWNIIRAIQAKCSKWKNVNLLQASFPFCFGL